MAYALVQAAQNSSSAGTAVTATFASPVTAGNLVVACVFLSSTTPIISRVTDNATNPNIFFQAIAPFDNTTRSYQFHGLAQSGGATTVTATRTAGASQLTVLIAEFSGAPSTWPMALVSTGSGTGTAQSVTSHTPTANSLIVAGYTATAATGAFTAGANYTLATSNANRAGMVYRLAASGGAETAPMTTANSVTWGGLSVEYKLSSGLSVLLQDDYDDTNGTNITAHTMDVGGGFTAHVGTWQINSNVLGLNASGGDGQNFTTADAGAADVVANCKQIVPGAGSFDAGLVVNLQDANNNWLGIFGGGSAILYERNGSGFTNRGSMSFSPAAGATIDVTIVTSGDSIVFRLDGIIAVSYSVGSRPFKTATRAGHRIFSTDAGTTFNNLLVLGVAPSGDAVPVSWAQYRRRRT